MQYPSGYNTGWAIVKSKVRIPVSAKKTQLNADVLIIIFFLKAFKIIFWFFNFFDK